MERISPTKDLGIGMKVQWREKMVGAVIGTINIGKLIGFFSAPNRQIAVVYKFAELDKDGTLKELQAHHICQISLPLEDLRKYKN